MNKNSTVSEFGERISWIINKVGGAGRAADLIGTTYTTLSRWKTNGADPSRENLLKISKGADVDLLWLMTGVGSPDPKKTIANQELQGQEDYIYIPTYNAEVSAGHGMFSEGVLAPDKYMAFRARWAATRGLDTKKLAVLFTKGDSMSPTIPEGAAVVIDRGRDKALDGKVYVIRIDDRLYVKRTQWIPSGGLRLISDNNQYDPFDIEAKDIEASDIEVCGQVIHASYDLPD